MASGEAGDEGADVLWRRARAAHGEEARDDALGGFPTTVIAGLLHTFTIQVEATIQAQGLSVQNCTMFKTRARRSALSLTKLSVGRDCLAVKERMQAWRLRPNRSCRLFNTSQFVARLLASQEDGEGRDTARPSPWYRPMSLLLAVPAFHAIDFRRRVLSSFAQSHRTSSC